MQETQAKILVWARSIDVVRVEMLFPPDFAITPLATALGRRILVRSGAGH